jgi:hypothetical protein
MRILLRVLYNCLQELTTQVKSGLSSSIYQTHPLFQRFGQCTVQTSNQIYHMLPILRGHLQPYGIIPRIYIISANESESTPKPNYWCVELADDIRRKRALFSPKERSWLSTVLSRECFSIIYLIRPVDK